MFRKHEGKKEKKILSFLREGWRTEFLHYKREFWPRKDAKFSVKKRERE